MNYSSTTLVGKKEIKPIEVIEAVEPILTHSTASPKYSVGRMPEVTASHGGGFGNGVNSFYDGDKFIGGFGTTNLFTLDYWTLRQRSNQLFTENLYARGIVQRLVTNEINTGLSPEASPDEKIIGVAVDSLDDWAEDVEDRFAIWGSNPSLCDFKKEMTFGALQRHVRSEALIDGDILIVLHQSRVTRLPTIQLIRGELVRTPLGGIETARRGHKITHGVETDPTGRQVAFWVTQDGGKSKRIPTVGEKSKRRIAWMVYGTEKRKDAVRGEPLLSIVLQSLKEIDRYRDSTQRKAVINSILAMFIEKTEDKMGTLPVTNGAIRRDSATVTDGDGGTRKFDIQGQIPGMVMEELQVGEKPVAFGSQGTDTNFETFETAILSGIAWALEMPPEILLLQFSNNYSASQAAINEFKMYLNMKRMDIGSTFDQPIYVEWLINQVLVQKISAPGFLQAWRDPEKWDIFGAWIAADWSGAIKPSTDIKKQAQGNKILVEEGWMTNARSSRELSGMKFSRNIRKIKRENELKVAAMRPLAEFEKEFGMQVDEMVSAKDNLKVVAENITEAVTENVLELVAENMDLEAS